MVALEQKPGRLTGLRKFFTPSPENKPQLTIPTSAEVFTGLTLPESMGNFVKDVSTKMIELVVSPRTNSQRQFIGLPITRELRSSVVRTEKELAKGLMSISDSSPSDSFFIAERRVQCTAIDAFIPPTLQHNFNRLMYTNPLLRDDKIAYIADGIDTLRITYISQDGTRRRFLTSQLGSKNWHILDLTDADSSPTVSFLFGTYNGDPEIDSLLENSHFSFIRNTTNAILNGFTVGVDHLPQTAA